MLNIFKRCFRNLPLFQLSDITYDGYLSLIEDSGELKCDLKVPENDVGKEIREKYENGEDILVSNL